MQSLHLVRRQPDRNPLRFGWHGRPPASPLKVSDNRMTDALFKDMSNGFPSGQAPSNWTRSCSGQFICHTKGIGCLDPAPWCWEGSVNFSVSGWHQLNTAMSFSSKDWAKNFVDQFKQIRQFAWDYERAFQLMPKPPSGVRPNPNPPPLRKRTPSVTPR